MQSLTTWNGPLAHYAATLFWFVGKRVMCSTCIVLYTG
ncbi:hypothetical protein FOWG_18035 [Fusarium oxysporum f. sp. lycopersici MN25]|nr:hypothetical protein FOWG_18035 [Fusarium oxysporum f. sp. lycopersici MN25]